MADLGYDGIEIPLKGILQYGKEKFKKMLAANNLKVIIMVMTDGPVAPGAGNIYFCNTIYGASSPGIQN